MLDLQCKNRLKALNHTAKELEEIYELLSTSVSNISTDFICYFMFETPVIAPNKLIKTLSLVYPHITFLLEGTSKQEFTTKTVIQEGRVVDVEELKTQDKHKSTIFNFEGESL